VDIDLRDFTTAAAVFAVLSPVIIAIVQAVKETGLVKPRYAPLAALGLGLLFGVLVWASYGISPLAAVAMGAMSGLSAPGLYDLGKKTIAGKDVREVPRR
jgi:hypothetical protein